MGYLDFQLSYRVDQETGTRLGFSNCTFPKNFTFWVTANFFPENPGFLKWIHTFLPSHQIHAQSPILTIVRVSFSNSTRSFETSISIELNPWSRAFKLESLKILLWFLVCLALTLFFLARCHLNLRNGGGQCLKFLILQQLQVQNHPSPKISS